MEIGCVLLYLAVLTSPPREADEMLARATIHVNERGVNAVAWSPDGKLLASGGYDGKLRLWDVAKRECIGTLVKGEPETEIDPYDLGWIASIEWGPGGRTLAAATGKRIILWDVVVKQDVGIFKGHTEDVTHIAWSPDGKELASTSEDGTVRVWDVTRRRQRLFVTGLSSDEVRCTYSVDWAPVGNVVASSSSDGTIKIWDAKTGKVQGSHARNGEAFVSVRFSPDGKILAAGASAEITLWNVARAESVGLLTGHSAASTIKSTNEYACIIRAAIKCLAFSPNGTTLASGSRDKSIRLWALPAGKCIALGAGHTDYVNDVAWSPDGRTIASAGEDGTIKLWDAAN